jgi:hypothetical protein
LTFDLGAEGADKKSILNAAQKHPAAVSTVSTWAKLDVAVSSVNTVRRYQLHKLVR